MSMTAECVYAKREQIDQLAFLNIILLPLRFSKFKEKRSRPEEALRGENAPAFQPFGALYILLA